MFDLQPLRHTSTLPTRAERRGALLGCPLPRRSGAPAPTARVFGWRRRAGDGVVRRRYHCHLCVKIEVHHWCQDGGGGKSPRVIRCAAARSAGSPCSLPQGRNFAPC